MRASLQMHEQKRYRGGREPRNARGLPEGLRPHGAEALARLVGQAAHGAVIEIIRERERIVVRLPLDLLALALEVARILRLDLELPLELLDEQPLELAGPLIPAGALILAG